MTQYTVEKLIMLAVFGFLGIVLAFYNKTLALYIADKVLTYFGWLLPFNCFSQRVLVSIYRGVFILGALFFAASVILFIFSVPA
jgi:hypothetical protein